MTEPTSYGQVAFEAFQRLTGASGVKWSKQPVATIGLWEDIALQVVQQAEKDGVLDDKNKAVPEEYVAIIEEPWIPKVVIHGEVMDMLHPLLMTPDQRKVIQAYGDTYVKLRELPAGDITDEITKQAYTDCGKMLQVFLPKLDQRQLKLMDLTDRYSLIHACFIAYDRILAERQNRVAAAAPRDVLQEVIDANTRA